MRRGSSIEKGTTMKKAILAVTCLVAGGAWADDADLSRAVAVDEIDERISVIEVIDVTAEKPPAAEARPDPEIDAILEAADALEEPEETGQACRPL